MAVKKLFTQSDGKCDILIVHAEHNDYAVAAPADQATFGYLVEFRVADNMTMIGKVNHVMPCKQFDDAWHSVSVFTRIHDAVGIYEKSWSETSDNT